MTIKFEKLDQILRQNAGTLFEKEIEDDMFLDYAISLKTMPLEEMTKRSWSLPESDLDEESDYEEEPVLPELLIKYLEKEADEEL
ncbi:hypothetical protein K0T92_16310 [Paenibacillus oenotherae]|uniref:Uncharacterized protein n=1 Tax=Paenibacillus oenotherae TaxID=1435645 RepID=A0ABS7D8N3_9BACL|nr:hypothetical protein [Paenibacillus oenotherae]MBW7476297.1 hypothetical protein [Paenibacillus oenotherae]